MELDDKAKHELALAWTYRPTGGTERERKAWENGFTEAVFAITETVRVWEQRRTREEAE